MTSVPADDDGVTAGVTVTATDDVVAGKPVGDGPEENGGDSVGVAADGFKNAALDVIFGGNADDGDGGRRNGHPRFPELDTLSFLRADDGGWRDGLPLLAELDPLSFLRDEDDVRRSSSLPRFAESAPLSSLFRASDEADVGRRVEEQPDVAAS